MITYNLLLSLSQSRPFLINDLYHRVCNKRHTTGATSGAGTTYSSGTHEFSPVVYLGLCYSFVFRCKQCSVHLYSRLACTCFIYVLCIYLRIMVFNRISKVRDVRVVYQ
jgi:hypothetical protein